MRQSVIVGTGCLIPSRQVANEHFTSNQFYETYGKTSDRTDNPRIIEKFHAITEIAERRYVEDNQVASDIAATAAERALQTGQIDRESLDYVIVAHNFGDVRHDNRHSDLVPSLAARVKQALQIANPRCIAYDLPFGCPGWLQAMIQADYFLRSGDASRALVIGAETLSRVCDPHDRDSMIYADGAGATILEAREMKVPGGILAHATRSDTLEHARLLWMGASYDPAEPGNTLYLKMNGRKLYEYALSTVPGVVKECLDRAGYDLGDVRKVLIHQANAKMDEAILTRLFRLYALKEIPAGIMPMTISGLGNSSVATLPTLLDLILRGEMEMQSLSEGDLVIFASVGAGMNVNALAYRWV